MGNATILQHNEELLDGGIHEVFKGAHIQPEVAEWYRLRKKKVEEFADHKDCDLIIDEVWVVEIVTATEGENGRYFFNNRFRSGNLDFIVLVAVDQPRMPMWSLQSDGHLERLGGWSFTRNFEQDRQTYPLTFLGYLRSL